MTTVSLPSFDVSNTIVCTTCWTTKRAI